MKYQIITWSTLFLLTSTLMAAKPFVAFQNTHMKNMGDPKNQAWNNSFEDNGDYGESWFFVSETEQGGTLFALMSITNLGLRTFAGVCDVQFYSPEGKRIALHDEYPRSEIKADTNKMDVQIGPNHVWRQGNTYKLLFQNKETSISATLTPELPAHQFGNGSTYFYEDNSAEWTIGFNAIRAKVSGKVSSGKKTWDLKGLGYHDHGLSTIKVPTFTKDWYTLRFHAKDMTIVLHDLHLTKKFGQKRIQMGMLGINGKIYSTRTFTYKPTAYRHEKNADYNLPTAYVLNFESNGYKVKGKITEVNFFESLDVLGQISWPVRMAIKAFYTNPYLIRYQVNVELTLTDPQGNSKHISGLGIAEANTY